MDWIVIVASVALAIIVGARARPRKSQKSSGAVDYILAGRTLTAPLFAASMIATWYGMVFGAAEFVTRYGIVMILCFGVPYYLVGVVYALFIARRMRSSSTVSIPHQIRVRYGAVAGFVSIAVLLVVAIPAPYILTIGYLVSTITGAPVSYSIIAGTVIALAVVARGGLRSDVRANVVHLITMYAGFIVLAVFCVLSFGTPPNMLDALPSSAMDVPGVLGWSGIAVWVLIALQTFIDPNFQVRVAASLTPQVAQKGLLLSVVGWIVFDGLQLIIGLYAVAYADVSDPSQTLMSVAQSALPPVWIGLFVASVIAAVVSTLDGYALVSATMIGHDLIDEVSGKGHRKTSLYVGLAITGTVGCIAAIVVPSIVDLLFYAASIAVPGILAPLLFSYWPEPAHQKYARLPAWMWIVLPALGSIVTLVTQLAGYSAIEPMFVGLVISVAMIPFVRRVRRAKS